MWVRLNRSNDDEEVKLQQVSCEGKGRPLLEQQKQKEKSSGSGTEGSGGTVCRSTERGATHHLFGAAAVSHTSQGVGGGVGG